MTGKMRAAIVCLSGMVSGGVAGAATEGFRINGSVQGALDGLEVRLLPAEQGAGRSAAPIATATVKDGAFTLTGKVDQPAPHSIVFVTTQSASAASPAPATGPAGRGQSYNPDIALFLENAAVAVSVVMADLPKDRAGASNGKPAHLRAQVKGSALHDAYVQYMEGLRPLREARNALYLREYSPYLRDRNTRPVSEGVALQARLDEHDAARKEYVRGFVRSHRGDAVGMYVAQRHIEEFMAPEIDALLAGFSSVMRTSAGWPSLQAKADSVKRSAVGAPFVDRTFLDRDGKQVKLSEHLGKGKYVLLEFWASWCGPCRAAIPHLKEAYALYNPAGFEVISVTLDVKREQWIKAMDEEKMPWLQLAGLDTFEGDLAKIQIDLSQAYNFTAVPACILISPDGKIFDRNACNSGLDRRLIQLYGDKFPARHTAPASQAKNSR